MKKIAGVVLAFTVLSLSGCSGKLTRSAAKRLTQAALDDTKNLNPYRQFRDGEAEVITGQIRGGDQRGPGVDVYPGGSFQTYSAFAKAGLITVAPLGKGMYTVALSDLGRKLLPEQFETECRYTALVGTVCLPLNMSKPSDGPILKQITYKGRLSEWQGYDLSGITQDELHATAVFTTYWKLTPLALALRGQAGEDGFSYPEPWHTFLSVHQSDYSHIEEPMTFDNIDGKWRVNSQPIAAFYAAAHGD